MEHRAVRPIGQQAGLAADDDQDRASGQAQKSEPAPPERKGRETNASIIRDSLIRMRRGGTQGPGAGGASPFVHRLVRSLALWLARIGLLNLTLPAASPSRTPVPCGPAQMGKSWPPPWSPPSDSSWRLVAVVESSRSRSLCLTISLDVPPRLDLTVSRRADQGEADAAPDNGTSRAGHFSSSWGEVHPPRAGSDVMIWSAPQLASARRQFEWPAGRAWQLMSHRTLC